MPKLLVMRSEKNKKERQVATSIQNMKKLCAARVEKDAEDTTYEILTVNVKMKLKNVVALCNLPWKKLKKHEFDAGDIEACHTLSFNAENGRWKLEEA